MDATVVLRCVNKERLPSKRLDTFILPSFILLSLIPWQRRDQGCVFIQFMYFPEMAIVCQRLHSERIEDIPSTLRSKLQDLDLRDRVKSGDTVAVAVGSRGITNIDILVFEIVSFLKGLGLKPFIVPAMGSHGGGTIEGELAVLAGLRITEATMGVPLATGTDVVEVGRIRENIPVLMDKGAAFADHIVVVNRIKPHTKFNASVESGLTKMLTVGLGKRAGATKYHQAAIRYTFRILQDAASLILKNCSVLFGLAILEDGYGHTASLDIVQPDDWFKIEPFLLEKAKSMIPKIPFDNLDVLIIDEIGKDVSGIGMDSNITGRHRDIVGDFFTYPHIKRIFVRNLSRKTAGNGNGIGLADFTTNRLVEALNLTTTYTNALAALSPEKAAIPVHFETDRECIEACLNMIGDILPEAARIVRIKNTSTLDVLEVSRALEKEIASNPDLGMVTGWRPMEFDDHGNLKDEF